jgi:hypothetical protein
MDVEWIIRIVLFSLVHWLLVGIMLQDITSRQRVFGGHKAPWVIIILIVPCFGSLLYLLFHPQILGANYEEERDRQDKKRK